MREDYLYWKFNWEWFGSLILLNNTLQEVNALLKPTVVRNYTQEFSIKDHRKGMSLIMKLCVMCNVIQTEGKKEAHPFKNSFCSITIHIHGACVSAQSLQSCPTLCSPTDCSSRGSSAHGILQVRILEWVAISFTQQSNLGLLNCRWILYQAT